MHRHAEYLGVPTGTSPGYPRPSGASAIGPPRRPLQGSMESSAENSSRTAAKGQGRQSAGRLGRFKRPERLTMEHIISLFFLFSFFFFLFPFSFFLGSHACHQSSAAAAISKAC